MRLVAVIVSKYFYNCNSSIATCTYQYFRSDPHQPQLRMQSAEEKKSIMNDNNSERPWMKMAIITLHCLLSAKYDLCSNSAQSDHIVSIRGSLATYVSY